MADQFRVTVELDGRNAIHPTYPLLPGDIILREPDGRWMKHAPGIAVGGFLLSAEDEATLEAADDARWVLA